jgi:hypothetical protein
MVRHIQCADRIEGELAVVRVRRGKLVQVAAHNIPMVDYRVALRKDGQVRIDYERFPQTLANSAMGMRLRYRLIVDVSKGDASLKVMPLTPWIDVLDNYYTKEEVRDRKGMMKLVANSGVLKAMPPCACGPRTIEAQGDLELGKATVLLAVSGGDHLVTLAISCRRSPGGRWVISGVQQQQ